VQDGLLQELGDKRIRVLQTGIAGERGVRFAAIVNQLKHFHGRGGLGAVMGAKRLKAIAVRGSKPPVAADKERARGSLTWFKEHYDRTKDRFHQLGSASGLLALEASGILPTRNFRDGSFEHARAISGQKMAETILVNRGTCYACAVACKREVEAPENGLSLAYALSPTGADHMEAPHDPLYAGFHPTGHPMGPLGLIEPLDPLVLDAKKVRAFFVTQQVWSSYNSIGMCDFVGRRSMASSWSRWSRTSTRHRLEHEPLRANEGRRAEQHARASLQLPRRLHAGDDVLPQRMHEGIGNGPLKGERIDPVEFLAARRVYYQMAGWDPETGRPTAAKLAELGVEEALAR